MATPIDDMPNWNEVGRVIEELEKSEAEFKQLMNEGLKILAGFGVVFYGEAKQNDVMLAIIERLELHENLARCLSMYVNSRDDKDLHGLVAADHFARDILSRLDRLKKIHLPIVE